ncbi:MAG TPA: hypothetical protein VK766_01955 [Cytophagaceae bacterium]|nr:hypothetical protein [Cytophagaceae bacterium]
MFKIEERSFGEFLIYYLKNTYTGEFVSILPSFGGALNQVTLCKGNKLYELLEGSNTFEEFITNGKAYFRGTKLFPFPNRLKDGQYCIENKVYQVAINSYLENHAIHGLVQESDFKVLDQVQLEEEALLRLYYQTSGKEEGYPFKVKIIIEYKLDKDGFSCRTTIENKDQQNIPVGDGWHPYIKTGSKIDDCFLTLSVEGFYEVDDRKIPIGKIIQETTFLTSTQISTTKFDTCYKGIETTDKILKTILEDPNHNISIVLWQLTGERGYNYVQVYTPPDRKSIAIEPMTCLANAFNNLEGLIVLAPNEKVDLLFGVRLE